MQREEIVSAIDQCKSKQKHIQGIIYHLKHILKKYHTTSNMKESQKEYQSQYYLKKKKLKNSVLYSKKESFNHVCAIQQTGNIYVEF
jgi:hypothetical protein